MKLPFENNEQIGTALALRGLEPKDAPSFDGVEFTLNERASNLFQTFPDNWRETVRSDFAATQRMSMSQWATFCARNGLDELMAAALPQIRDLDIDAYAEIKGDLYAGDSFALGDLIKHFTSDAFVAVASAPLDADTLRDKWAAEFINHIWKDEA